MPVVWPWMTLEESGQAVPPAYTEFIGRLFLGAEPETVTVGSVL